MAYIRQKLFWGVFRGGVFYVADTNFKVLEQTTAFNRKGNFTKKVKELGIKYDFDVTDSSMWRTDDDIETLQENVERLERLVHNYNARKIRNK